MATARWSRLALAAALTMTVLQVLVMAPAGHAATLTAGIVNWSVSKAHPGDTAVRYTWAFETATTATLSKITFTVPDGTAGTLTVADAYGVPGGSATLDTGPSPDVVTYTITAPVSVAAGVKVLIALDGFTNTATTGDYASTLTSYDNQAIPAAVDIGTSNTVSIADNTTDVTVVIARSTVFTNDTTGFDLVMDPSNDAYADQTKGVTLAVKTNAGSGYALDVRADTLDNADATRSITPVTSDLSTGIASASFTADRWGYAIGTIGGDAKGVRQGALVNGDYVGYRTTNDRAVVATGPTNGDTITFTNRVKIDYLQPADTYRSTITYTVTPTY
jgi:hypothetical protein